MRAPAPVPNPARGMAALTVVMSLFFVMALVAAYTNRNIVFEQRMSASTLRGERAMALADGAVDWTISMLNDGLIDASCQPSANGADDFRSRYLSLTGTGANNGSYRVRSNFAQLPPYPGCQMDPNGALLCTCPTLAAPNPAVNGGDAGNPAFRVSFLSPPSGYPMPGNIVLQIRGCSNTGTTGNTCYARNNNQPDVDARADVRANVGMVRVLPTPPRATLTAGRDIGFAPGAATIQIANRDNPTGLVLHAGRTISNTSGNPWELSGPAGSAMGLDALRLQNDPDLRNLIQPDPANPALDQALFFRSLFGMDATTLRELQGTRVITPCTAAPCTLASLTAAQALTTYAGKVVFVDGDLNLSSAPAGNAMGSSATPLVLIVNGQLTVGAGINFTGFIFAQNIAWSHSGASLRGAMLAAADFTATTNVRMTYDSAVLELIRYSYGTYVRVPGGWNRGGF